ncbi:hypothetical protein J2T38_001842, partial [Neisseria perflava]|nr:hypothetical protein [Neisseria perflava]
MNISDGLRCILLGGLAYFCMGSKSGLI